MVILVVILHTFVCLFLIAVILLQAGRGQGLSWGVFGGTPESILGTKTSSFLSRLTTICAILFLFTCIILNIIETRKARSLLAPSKRVSQIDIAKIKKALEEAEAAKKGEAVKEPTASIPTTPEKAQTVPAATTQPPQNQSKTSGAANSGN